MPGYQREYKIRRVNLQDNSFQVTYPADILEREARIRGITVEELLKRVHVVAEFDTANIVTYTLTDNLPTECQP